MTNDFLVWLSKGSSIVKSVYTQVIGVTLTVKVYTLADGRVFVSADRALVSYDNGTYMNYSKGDYTDNAIMNIEYKGSYAQGA